MKAQKPINFGLERRAKSKQENETNFLKNEAVEKVEEKNGTILKLNKSIYGLVQAARQWHKKFKKIITSMGFDKNQINPCMF
jgi:Reverse transcriptase (RNA-dependent DNA polymerase)